MRDSRSLINNFDWPLVLMYLLLIFIGWINIYAATYTEDHGQLLQLEHNHGRQLSFILGSFVLIILVLVIDSRLFIYFTNPIYIVSILSLIAVLVFGEKISGARSWFYIGPLSIQPGEFAKVAAALALSHYMSKQDFNFNRIGHRLRAFFIVFLPAAIIYPQPDLGSAIVFSAFILVFYREGLSGFWIFLALALGTLFIFSLIFDPLKLTIAFGVMFAVILFAVRKRKKQVIQLFGLLILIAGFIQSVDYAFDNLLEDRHRNRINIMLGLEHDPQGVGYNTHQSQIAIGSGGFSGKGFLQGTQTKFNFVPEQHTDFIFCTIGEEWGFLGSSFLVILFVMMISRIIFIAERQKLKMSRIYGYAVASIIFFHFTVNIAMTIGLFPVIGIPLPFVSYGGSSLWAFTLLLFILVKMDAERKFVL